MFVSPSKNVREKKHPGFSLACYFLNYIHFLSNLCIIIDASNNQFLPPLLSFTNIGEFFYEYKE